MSSIASNATYQQQTILNLYNSGITTDIIAQQLNTSQEEVNKIIESAKIEEERKKISIKILSDSSSSPSSLGSSFNLNKIVDVNSAINAAQSRVWKALKAKPEFNMSFEETQNVLEEFAESKLILVVLHVDLVGSPRLTMTLPIDRIATIIQAFYQEMSVLITSYGGYVLKYIGDAILAFFLVSTDVSLSCANAVYCARSIIKVMQQGINPILSQYDYPEINVRIGIDVGENTVIRCGWDIHTNNTTTYSALRKEETKNSNDNNNKKEILIKKPVYDVLGYTISITAKMTALAKPNQIVIGELVYDALDIIDQKSTFQLLHVDHEIWDYVSDYTGDVYRLYGSI